MCFQDKRFQPDPNCRPSPEEARKLRTIRGTKAVADDIGLSPRARDKAQRSFAHSTGAALGGTGGGGDSLEGALMGLLWKRKSNIPKDYSSSRADHQYDPTAPGTKFLFGDKKGELMKLSPEERAKWEKEKAERDEREEEERIRKWNEERDRKFGIPGETIPEEKQYSEGMTVGTQRRVLHAASAVMGAIARA